MKAGVRTRDRQRLAVLGPEAIGVLGVAGLGHVLRRPVPGSGLIEAVLVDNCLERAAIAGR